jgi:triosephosphate isomerase
MFTVGTSWKMNKTLAEARDYAAALAAADLPSGAQLFVCPPFTAISTVREALAGKPVWLGAQDVMWEDAGAFTGEISPVMLNDVGCEIVEIGHSERRAMFGETDARVHLKARAIQRHGMRPLICIGETAAERSAGRAADTILRQARIALDGLEASGCFLAYEPVWAIGEHGTPASPEQAAEMHAALKSAFPDVPVLYGGSVNLDNAAALAARREIDGLFIGRAAWSAEGLLAIAMVALAARPGA